MLFLFMGKKTGQCCKGYAEERDSVADIMLKNWKDLRKYCWTC